MKKTEQRLGLAVLISFIAFAMAGCAPRQSAETPEPAWVQNPHRLDEQFAYFVGRSDSAANYGHFLEARAGALADALFQFSAYRNVEVSMMITDYVSNDTEFQEDIKRLISGNESAGLYQQAEWADRDGTLYLLYSYAAEGRPNPRPDLSDAYAAVSYESDRVYFASLAVSSQDDADLALQAEQSARLQALLWLGADVSMELSEYYAETVGQDSFEYFSGAFAASSGVDLSASAFREDSRRILRGRDNNYYFYGVYSISGEMPEYAEESAFFSYAAAYSNSPEAFDKHISLFENSFTRDAPYTAESDSALEQLSLPDSVQWYMHNQMENEIIGIGYSVNASMEIRRLSAGARAISSLSQQTSAMAAADLTDAAAASGALLSAEDDIARSLASSSLQQLQRKVDYQEADSAWQVWSMSKTR